MVSAVSPRVKPIMSLSGQIGLQLFSPGQRRRAESQVQMLPRSKLPGAHSAGLMKSPVLSLHQELKRLWERHMEEKKKPELIAKSGVQESSICWKEAYSHHSDFAPAPSHGRMCPGGLAGRQTTEPPGPREAPGPVTADAQARGSQLWL